MKKLLTVTLLTAMSAGLLLAQPPQGQRQQRPWANYTRYHDANAQVAPRRDWQDRVVFMGNSITEGWVNTHPNFFKENGYIGRGISGQTSFQYLLRFREDVINLDPTIMVLNAGTNDIAENNNGPYNEEITLGNIKTMVELARTNGIKVILTSTLPCGQFGWNKSITDGGQKIVELNKKIAAYAREQGIPFVNYHKEMVGPDGVSMRAELSNDGCHPNSDGYDIMEALIQKAIKSLTFKKE